jgi:hypothetical protein
MASSNTFNDQPDTSNPPDTSAFNDIDALVDHFLKSPSPNDFVEDPTSSDFALPPSVVMSSSSVVAAAKNPSIIALRERESMHRLALAAAAAQTPGSTLPVPPPALPVPPPPPASPAAGNNDVPNPFRNINPSDVGEMEKLVGHMRALAGNSNGIYRKLSELGRLLLGKPTRRMTSAQQIDAALKRFEKEAKSDDGAAPGAALLGHNYFNWKLNTKTAKMPDDTKLPHQTDPAFPAAAAEHNKKEDVATAGHQEGYIVARNVAAAMEKKIPGKPHQPRTTRLSGLFTTEDSRVWERANGPSCTAKVNFRDGPRKDSMAALDDAVALAAAVISVDELKAAIGAPEDALNFKAVAAARATYEPLEDGDVATASKSAFAAFAIATAALECARDTGLSMPWAVVSDSEKKRLLAADLGVGEDPETRAKKLHKAANGNPGLLFFYMLQNGNKF